LHRLKSRLPPAARQGLRRRLAALPLAAPLARARLCPPRVGFLLGGAMKAGTTALSAFLGRHPEVCMASGKEAHFFDDDEQFRPGARPDYAAYHRLFAPGPDAWLLGDATPVYLYWGPAAARAAAYDPRLRWVLLLRQPAERAYSHWNAARRAGREPLPFAEAVRREPGRWAPAPQGRAFSYLDRGYYARQLRRLFAVVPRRRVLALRSEGLLRDHHATLRHVFEFLGVDPGVRVEPAVVHASSYEAPLPGALRRELTARFADDIRDLERLLGWDLSEWLSA
jgi:hypothetical protein